MGLRNGGCDWDASTRAGPGGRNGLKLGEASAGRDGGMEVSLWSLRRVSLAPRCRPFSPVLHACGFSCMCIRAHARIGCS